MTLRLTQLQTVSETPLQATDQYLLIVGMGVEEIASETDIRMAINLMFELSKTLTGVSRMQTFESEIGKLLEIEQDVHPEMICVRVAM